jgi:hypothetical protein
VGIRETMGKKQSLTVIAAAVVLLGSVVAIIVQARSFSTTGGGGNAYYTTDDGQTFFAASTGRLEPFDVSGKQAVRAHVFECNGKRVVGYVQRYTPDALALFAEVKAAKGARKPPANIAKMATVGTTGTELKLPGAANRWVSAASPAAARIRVFKCSDGKVPPEVFPD